MNAQTEEEFFAITLSQQAAGYVLRGFNLIRWTFVLSIIFSTCLLLLIWIRYFEYFLIYDVKNSPVLFIQFRVEPIVMVATTIVNVIQVSFYFRFIQLCRRGIANREADVFNNSFKWLIRNAVLACIILAVNLLFIFFNIYVEVKRLVVPAITT